MGEVENRVRGKGVGGEQGESDGNKRKVHLERLLLRFRAVLPLLFLKL